MAAQGSALAVFVLLASTTWGCGQAGTPIQPSTKPQRQTVLRAPVCSPGATSAVNCTVSMWFAGQGDVDVTRDATWFVTDSNLVFDTPSSVAAVSAPGVFIPIRPGNISIQASYLGDRQAAPHTYAVDPNSPAVALAPYLMGFVSELDGTTPIAGVRVEIANDGADSGKSDITRVNGYYFINHVRMNTPLTVRASKAGFVSSVQTHPGITDNVYGYPGNNFLHFRLARVPAS